MPMKALFFSLSILFEDAIDSCHIQIFMKVAIANVPGGIHDTTEYSILEPLYDFLLLWLVQPQS
jgi:hypothetical protein